MASATRETAGLLPTLRLLGAPVECLPVLLGRPAALGRPRLAPASGERSGARFAGSSQRRTASEPRLPRCGSAPGLRLALRRAGALAPGPQLLRRAGPPGRGSKARASHAGGAGMAKEAGRARGPEA